MTTPDEAQALLPVTPELFERIATTICQTVAEIPDRSSPDDWPEAMLVTADELQLIVMIALESEAERISHPLPGDTLRAIELLREYMDAEEIDDVDERASELGACRFSVRAFLAALTPSALSGDKGGSDFLGMFDGPLGVVNRPTQKYRKTALITATQWFKDGDHPAVRMSDDIREAMETGHAVPWIETLEGGHIVTPGDWIATGVQGEHWPIKADIFAATYEPVRSALSGDAGEGALREENKRLLSHVVRLVLERDRLREAGCTVLDGLDRRIEASALTEPCPVFEGIVELRDAIAAASHHGAGEP